MLILEDVETIVNNSTRSYFFNEVDGLENNDGILMLASTNFLDRLDPGLSKRPSRFDRKYLFPLPNQHERDLYAQYWRHKLEDKPSVIFPKSLCPAMAKITQSFSFAYMQEAFVASLLEIARRHTDGIEASDDSRDDDPECYLLWRVFKSEVKLLRKDMDAQSAVSWGTDLSHGSTTSTPAESPQTTDLGESAPLLPGAFGGRGPSWPTQDSFASFPEYGKQADIRRIAFGPSGTDSSLAAWGRNDDVARMC